MAEILPEPSDTGNEPVAGPSSRRHSRRRGQERLERLCPDGNADGPPHPVRVDIRCRRLTCYSVAISSRDENLKTLAFGGFIQPVVETHET